MKHIALLGASALAVSLIAVPSLIPTDADRAVAAPPASVILDLDIQGDVDDVGALAELHALADLGEANILGITVNTSSQWGPSAVDAINTYHGRPDIPIGRWAGPTFNPTGTPGNFTEVLSTEFPRDLNGGSAESSTSLLRRLLASQPDDSVTVIGIGFLNNLRALLDSSGDQYSPLNGAALIDQKVKSLSLMGGYYPSGEDGFNWWLDRASAARVINDWPGDIIFNGLGADVGTGPRLAGETPVTNPSRRAYALFPGASTPRPSWDQVSVLAAVRRGGTAFTETRGENVYRQSDGNNTFTSFSGGPHTFLTSTQSTSSLATVIEDLMVRPPASTAVANGVYRFTAKHSGKVLDVYLCSATGAVQQYQSLDNDCQKFRVTAVGGGYHRIDSVATGLVLDVYGFNTANGGAVVQHQWLNGDNQKWAFGPTGDGRMRIVNKHSGLTLDVPNASTANSVAVWQYQWLNGDNQKWGLSLLAP